MPEENDIHQRFIEGMKGRANEFLDSGGENDGSAADDAINSGKQAMRTGRDAIRNGKRAMQAGKKVGEAGRGAIRMGSKAAASAAKAGGRQAAAVVANVAGAKVKVGAAGVITAVILALVLIFTLMSVPNAIFETAQDMVESWETIKYTDEHDGNGFLNVLDFIGTTAKKAGDSLGDAIKGLWNKLTNSKDTDSDNASEDDVNAVTAELTSRLTTIKKALGVNDKYRTRANQVKNGISDQSNRIDNVLYEMIQEKYSGYPSQQHDPTGEEGRIWQGVSITAHIDYLGTDKGTAPFTSKDVVEDLQKICDAASEAATLEELENFKQEFTDTVENEFPQITDDGKNNSEALAYLYLASVQLGGSVEEMKVSDFMKYLGYTGSGKTYFNIGHVERNRWLITGSVPAWEGSFQPQYLMEELKHYQDELIMADIYEDEARESALKDITQEYKDDGAPLTDLIVSLDFPNLNFDNLALKDRHYESHSINNDRDWLTRYTYVYENPDGEQGTLMLQEWDICYGYRSQFPTTRHYRKFYIDYYIQPRTSPEIMSLVGLWDGEFPAAEGG